MAADGSIGSPGSDGSEDELLLPLAAAIRMILPGYLRRRASSSTSTWSRSTGSRQLCIFDRTPGASGFARFVCERGLRELLELARMVLERCVGPEFARLRHVLDRTAGSDPARWRVGEALRWLDEVLDAPPPEQDADVDERRRSARRVRRG